MPGSIAVNGNMFIYIYFCSDAGIIGRKDPPQSAGNDCGDIFCKMSVFSSHAKDRQKQVYVMKKGLKVFLKRSGAVLQYKRQ